MKGRPDPDEWYLREPAPRRDPTEYKDVAWDDDFSPLETRRFRWDLICDQLRQRPGHWAKIVNSGGRTISQAQVDRRDSTIPVELRRGRWQVATRYGELWMRYLGDE